MPQQLSQNRWKVPAFGFFSVWLHQITTTKPECSVGIEMAWKPPLKFALNRWKGGNSQLPDVTPSCCEWQVYWESQELHPLSLSLLSFFHEVFGFINTFSVCPGFYV